MQMQFRLEWIRILVAANPDSRLQSGNAAGCDVMNVIPDRRVEGGPHHLGDLNLIKPIKQLPPISGLQYLTSSLRAQKYRTITHYTLS